MEGTIDQSALKKAKNDVFRVISDTKILTRRHFASLLSLALAEDGNGNAFFGNQLSAVGFGRASRSKLTFLSQICMENCIHQHGECS